jgi:hypothetical protein
MRIWALAIFSPIDLPPANTESCKSTLREDRRRSPKEQKYWWSRSVEGESEGEGEGEGEEGVRSQSSR